MQDGHFAERVVSGLDDGGREERVLIWIERKPGAVWAIGRIVNPQQRDCATPHATDYVWEGYELDDCLEIANEWLEEDVTVTDADGGRTKTLPFTRREIEPRLERIFLRG